MHFAQFQTVKVTSGQHKGKFAIINVVGEGSDEGKYHVTFANNEGRGWVKKNEIRMAGGKSKKRRQTKRRRQTKKRRPIKKRRPTKKRI